MRCVRLLFVVAGLAWVSACAPPPCSGDLDIVERTDELETEGRVDTARLEGDQLVLLASGVEPEDGQLTLKFDVIEGSPARVPSAGAVISRGGANGFGEGADTTFWSIPGVFEVGTVGLLDDDEASLRPFGSHVSVRSPPGIDGGCDAGNGQTEPAAVVILTDAGDVVLLPGERRVVTIDGENWQALAGRAGRHSFFNVFDCTDCAGLGSHSTTDATAVLYRIDD